MKLFLSVFVSLFAFTAIADTHSDDELAVLESLNAYYDARRNEDWKKVVSMESSAGVLSTNSDGSQATHLDFTEAVLWFRRRRPIVFIGAQTRDTDLVWHETDKIDC